MDLNQLVHHTSFIVTFWRRLLLFQIRCHNSVVVCLVQSFDWRVIRHNFITDLHRLRSLFEGNRLLVGRAQRLFGSILLCNLLEVV